MGSCRRASYVRCSRRSVPRWQGARGERLTVGVMLPGRQDWGDWLNFMLSQKNLWPTTRSTLTKELTVQAFSKKKRRLQAEHLWTNINLKWKVLSDRMCVHAPTGKPKEYLNTLLFDPATRRNRKDPYEEKRCRGADTDAVTRCWKQCGSWMAQ